MKKIVNKVVNVENVLSIALAVVMTILTVLIILIVGINDFVNVFLFNWIVSESPKVFALWFIVIRSYFYVLDNIED